MVLNWFCCWVSAAAFPAATDLAASIAASACVLDAAAVEIPLPIALAPMASGTALSLMKFPTVPNMPPPVPADVTVPPFGVVPSPLAPLLALPASVVAGVIGTAPLAPDVSTLALVDCVVVGTAPLAPDVSTLALVDCVVDGGYSDGG